MAYHHRKTEVLVELDWKGSDYQGLGKNLEEFAKETGRRNETGLLTFKHSTFHPNELEFRLNAYEEEIEGFALFLISKDDALFLAESIIASFKNNFEDLNKK
jgi:predicted TIM-barrel fold metal-dependent hydrolase